jgi:hypothetical protein
VKEKTVGVGLVAVQGMRKVKAVMCQGLLRVKGLVGTGWFMDPRVMVVKV